MTKQCKENIISMNIFDLLHISKVLRRQAKHGSALSAICHYYFLFFFEEKSTWLNLLTLALRAVKKVGMYIEHTEVV